MVCICSRYGRRDDYCDMTNADGICHMSSKLSKAKEKSAENVYVINIIT